MDVIEKEREERASTEKGNEASAEIKKEKEDYAGIKKENGTGVEAKANEDRSLQGKIIRFVEMVFGDYNLMNDPLLKQEVLLDDGWVAPDILFKLYSDHISWLNESVPIIEALKKSTSGLMEVCMQTGRIRRSPEKPLPEDTPEKDLEIETRTVYCKGFPRDGMDIHTLSEFFRQHPTVEHVQMRYFENKQGDPIFKGSVTATFGTREQAETFMSHDVVKYNDYQIARQWCADWEVEKTAELEELEALQAFMRGTIIKLTGIPDGTDREKIEEALAGTSVHVCIVDFLPDHVALVLIHGDAKLVLDQLDDGKITIGDVSVEASVLKGEEEKAALMEIKDHMDNSSNSQGYDSDQDYDEDSSSEEPSAATDEKSQGSPEPGNPAEKARGD